MTAKVSLARNVTIPAIAFGLALVLLANSFAWAVHVARINRDFINVPWAALLLTGALWWARTCPRIGWAEIGLAGREWKRSAMIGVLIGLGLGVLLAISFLFPVVLSGPVRYRDIEELSGIGLVWRMGVELTFAVAFAEEVLFRGILQALWRRSSTIGSAVVLTNAFFSLWHLVVGAFSLQQNTVSLPFMVGPIGQIIGYVGALLAVGIGGVILSLLRERTGHLAGSVVVHWIADAAMTIVLYWR